MDEGSKKTLDSVNRVSVTKDEILEFVAEIGKRAADERDFEGRALVLMRLHKGNPEKCLAIEFRMEALAHVMGDSEPRGWTLPAMPDGAVPTAGPVFAAAAVQPLIANGDRPAFERGAFFDKVLELASVHGQA